MQCLSGLTQIGRVLKHAIKETDKQQVDALVVVGDCFEEDPDAGHERPHHRGQRCHLVLAVELPVGEEDVEPRRLDRLQVDGRAVGEAEAASRQ